MTVKTSSSYSNRLCCQLPNWLMTNGTDLKRMLCKGRPTKQMVDFGKLNARKLVMWTQSNLEYLKGGVVAAQDGLARGIVKIASGVVRFGLWIESKPRRDEIAMS